MFSNSPDRKQRPLKIGEFIYEGQVVKVSTGMKDPIRETAAIEGGGWGGD